MDTDIQVLQELLENLVSYLARILARIRLYKNLALNCARFTALNLAHSIARILHISELET